MSKYTGEHDLFINFGELKNSTEQINLKINILEEVIQRLENVKNKISENKGEAITQLIENCDKVISKIRSEKRIYEEINITTMRYIEEMTGIAKPVNENISVRVNRGDSENKINFLRKLTANFKHEMTKRTFINNTITLLMSKEEKEEARARGEEIEGIEQQTKASINEIEASLERMEQIHKKTEEFEEADNRYARKMRELINTHNDHMKTIKEIEEIGLGFAIDYWRIEEILKKEPSELTQSDYNYLIEAFNKALEKDLAGEGNPKELKNVSKFIEYFFTKTSFDTKGVYSRSQNITYRINGTMEALLNKYKEMIEKEGDISKKLKLINEHGFLEGLYKNLNIINMEYYHIKDLTRYPKIDIKIKETKLGYKVDINEKEFLYYKYTNNLSEILKEISSNLTEKEKQNLLVELSKYMNGVIGGNVSSDELSNYPVIKEILGVLGTIGEVTENNNKIDEIINNLEMSTILEIFCVSGTITTNQDGSFNLSNSTIDYEKLAKKISIIEQFTGVKITSENIDYFSNTYHENLGYFNNVLHLSDEEITAMAERFKIYLQENGGKITKEKLNHFFEEEKDKGRLGI